MTEQELEKEVARLARQEIERPGMLRALQVLTPSAVPTLSDEIARAVLSRLKELGKMKE